jgi:hypothetical protein
LLSFFILHPSSLFSVVLGDHLTAGAGAQGLQGGEREAVAQKVQAPPVMSRPKPARLPGKNRPHDHGRQD